MVGQWKGLYVSEQNKQPRRSKIVRGIKRTLSTAQFETLVIEIGFEEEIEWTSLSERQQKIDNWNTVLLADFKQTSDRLLNELGLNHKKAYFKNPTEETVQKYAGFAAQEAKELSEKVKSQSAINLDELDTLG